MLADTTRVLTVDNILLRSRAETIIIQNGTNKVAYNIPKNQTWIIWYAGAENSNRAAELTMSLQTPGSGTIFLPHNNVAPGGAGEVGSATQPDYFPLVLPPLMEFTITDDSWVVADITTFYQYLTRLNVDLINKEIKL